MPQELKIEVLSPSEIQLDSNMFCGSDFGKSEFEQMAYNLVVIFRNNQDFWFPFTYDQYAFMVNHKIPDTPGHSKDRRILDEMVDNGFLTLDKSEYECTQKFHNALRKYAIK